MSDFDTFFTEFNKDERPECKGLFFRYTENNYAYGGTVSFGQRIKLLKSRSCRGCERCDWISDDIYEGVVNYGSGYIVFATTSTRVL